MIEALNLPLDREKLTKVVTKEAVATCLSKPYKKLVRRNSDETLNAQSERSLNDSSSATEKFKEAVKLLQTLHQI